MKPEQFAKVLRAASELVDDAPIVMVSQVILGIYDEA